MRQLRFLTACLFPLLTLNLAPTQSTASSAVPTMEQVLNEWVTNAEKLVVPAAEAMSESGYSFAPRNGEFSGVRTFAEQVKHLAAANYQLGSRALGEPPPTGTKGEAAPDSVRTKAQILEYLKGSFACLHRAAQLGNTSMLAPLPGSQGKQTTRLGLIIDALAHSENHYGQMVEYLRMNGIVPPESR